MFDNQNVRNFLAMRIVAGSSMAVGGLLTNRIQRYRGGANVIVFPVLSEIIWAMMSGFYHPDLLAFLAILAFPVSLYLTSKGTQSRERGYQALFWGTVWVTCGTLLDYLEQIEQLNALFPFMRLPSFNWVISGLFIAPGALLAAWGILQWFPVVDRMAEEIKHRILIEKDLRDSEERFRIMVQHAPEAITMLDAETGIYVECNPAAEKLHGYSREEIVGKYTPWQLSPENQPDGRPSSVVALEKLNLARSGEHPRFEWLHLDRQGRDQLCEVSLVRLPDEHDNLIRASVIDITERKRTEEALRQAQKMEALTVLSSGAAHDFNNLLSVIHGVSGLIETKSEQDAKLVEEIQHAVDRGVDLTRRLVAYARQKPMTPKPLDVCSVLDRFADTLRMTLGAAIEIEVRAPGDLWQAMADVSQLEDAILNLAINARDAMPGGGRIQIECRNVTLDAQRAAELRDGIPGEFVALSVADSGHGIDEQHLGRVFEPFYTTKEPDAGSGLGLAMVFGFASQTGGFVDLQSEVGFGTTVTIYLPRA